jgi:type I restriction-modification system DNA methylase subunit
LGIDEDRVSRALARLLRRHGFKERVEIYIDGSTGIVLLYKGFRIALEGSYEAHVAEKNAIERLESGLCDIAVAIWYDRHVFPGEVAEDEIEEILERSVLRARFFIPGENVTRNLSHFLEKRSKGSSRELLTQGWLRVNVSLLRDSIDQAIQHLVLEERVRKAEEEIERFINRLIKTLGSVDRDLAICRELYNVFHKLYGLSIGEVEDIREMIYGKAALAILLSAIFYESIRAKHGLKPLKSLVRGRNGLSALEKAFDNIVKINNQPIFSIAKEIVEKLPIDVQPAIMDLIGFASNIASNKTLLRRDFAGKIYHTIVGSWAVRKNLATYFTGIPSSYLLARLALATPNRAWQSLSSLENFRTADLACGSGTLLSASYDGLLYLYTRDRLKEGLEVDVEGFHKTVLEKTIWGLDSLRFATYITSTILALHNPEASPQSMNIYTAPLGIGPNGSVFMGSLDLVRRTLTNYPRDRDRKGEMIDLPERFDLIIMNPPFTRATGRGGRKEAGLFGFIADKHAREKLLRSYKRLREYVRYMLSETSEGKAFLKELETSLNGDGVKTFLEIGQAGEGLLFLYIAGELVKEGGRIAFVLPRNLLSGVSWFLARSFLASRFHLEYVIVSNDPEEGYGFSESTDLSECLVIARRVEKHVEDERTCIVNLVRKPRTALEGVWLAHEIIDRCGKAAEIDITLGSSSLGSNVEAGRSCGIVYTIPRRLLLKHLDNWGKLLAYTNPRLSNHVLELLDGRIRLGAREIRIPVKRLGEIAVIGIDRHQFHDSFRRAAEAPGSLPALYGGGEELRSRLQTDPNAWILPKDERARRLFEMFANNLLVPERIRFNTAHVTAIYVTKPVLSNIFYAVKLKTGNDAKKLKALCLWLNTTWGIMSIIAHREETEGAWSSLKITHWKLLPVLDITSLPEDKINTLSEIFDMFKHSELKRLPEQYSPPQEERIELDTMVLKVLEPSLRRKEVRERLVELYRDLYQFYSRST